MALVVRAKNEEQTVLACCGDVKVVENAWYYDPNKVETQYLKKTERTYNCPYKGVAHWYDLEAPGVSGKNVAWVYEHPSTGFEHIAGLIAFYERETSMTTAAQEEQIEDIA